MAMQLVDRIEKRRFVGREFLLWLWFESEIFEGTLHTAEHGSFGFWIERQISLTSGKEGTRIKGSTPAFGREAKESLRKGKLPEAAGFHLVDGNQESSFTLKAEQLGIAGLKLPTVLGGEEDAPAKLLDGPPKLVKRKKETVDRQEARESDETHEAFYERMNLTREIEARLEALYRDFIALRLGEKWETVVVPAIRAWAAGDAVDADAYREERGSGKRAGKKKAAGRGR